MLPGQSRPATGPEALPGFAARLPELALPLSLTVSTSPGALCALVAVSWLSAELTSADLHTIQELLSACVFMPSQASIF